MRPIVLACLTALMSAPAGAAINTLSETRSRFLPSPVRLTGIFESPSLNLALAPKQDGVGEVRYLPNARTSWGIGLNYEGFGGSLRLPISQNENEMARKGKTTHFDLVLSQELGSGVFDLFIARYKGFYRDDQARESSNSSFDKRPDLASEHYGLNYTYVFRNEQYKALGEGDTPDEANQNSGGHSPLAQIGINRLQLLADTSLIRSEDGLVLDPKSLIRNGRFDSVTFGLGWGGLHRWKQSAFGAHGLVGFGPQWQELGTEPTPVSRVALATKVTLEMVYVYSFSGWRTGLGAKLDQVNADLGANDLRSQMMSVRLFANTDI